MGFGYCKTLTPRNFSHERRLTYDITLHLRRHNEMSASPREKIKRLAVACVRRGSFISLCLYVLGLVVASLAPSLARDVYVDENAFLVGSTHATFDDLDGARADDYVETLTKITFDARSRARTTRERLEWVLNALDERGFESYKSRLDGAGDLFNVHGVARAARGRSALKLSGTPYSNRAGALRSYGPKIQPPRSSRTYHLASASRNTGCSPFSLRHSTSAGSGSVTIN